MYTILFSLMQELLYLYGFVIDNNPDDYLMVHYPLEAIHSVSFSESKLQLLEAQKAELRCLLPRSLLDHGFFPAGSQQKESINRCTVGQICNYSWCGQRKMPSYLNKLVFPEDFLTALRTIAMQEDELCRVSSLLQEEDDLYRVSSLLQELVGSGGERQPTNQEVRAAIWESCGDSGALQLLVDLLNMKLVDLEEGSGTENDDTALLEKTCSTEISPEYASCQTNGSIMPGSMSKNRWASIVYRRGQKQLARLFLNEAEHALQVALSEGN
ncbi:hypothetical protein U1Q18_036150 [Sarracenia purpurea var. burkii]